MVRRLLKGASIYAISDVLRKVSPFLLLPIFTSNLSVGDFGRLEYVSIISTFLTFLIGWGSIQGVLRLYVDYGGKVVYSSIVMVSGFAVLLFILIYFLNISIGLFQLIDLESSDIIYMIIVFAWLYSVNNIALSVLRINEDLKLYALVNLVSTILQVVTISVLVFYMNGGYLSKVKGLILSNFLVSLYLFIIVVRKEIEVCFDKRLLTKMMSFFSPIALNNLIGWGGASVDKIAVKILLGDEALGVYGLISQIVQIFKLGFESFLKSLNVLVYKSSHYLNVVVQYKNHIKFSVGLVSIAYLYFILELFDVGIFEGYDLPVTAFAFLVFSRALLLSNYLEALISYVKVDSFSVMRVNVISFVILLVFIIPFTDRLGLVGAAGIVLMSAMINSLLLTYSNDRSILSSFRSVFSMTMPWLFILFLWN